jgi:type II secretory ATPase GspE/PulE/Tfp pilus assembly ATPase PilB-like protein
METLEHGVEFEMPLAVTAAVSAAAMAVHGLVLEELSGGAHDTPAQLLDHILVDAYRGSVAEISIEADAEGARVWFRLDEVMLEYMQVPAHLCAGLVERAKVMCKLNVAEHRIAQIGRVDFEQVGSERIALRVAIVPNAMGLEDIRLRLVRAPLAVLPEVSGAPLAPEA